MFAARRRVKRISVGLTKVGELMTRPSPERKRDSELNPRPRTDTTVPAGTQPSPGTTSPIATLPPTVTVAGDIRARTDAPLRLQMDEGSKANVVRVPGMASGRI